MWTDEQLQELKGVLRKAGSTKPGRVIRALGTMAAVYGDRAMTFDRAAVYARFLADLDPDALDAAVDALARTAKWMPTVAEIRERCTTANLAAAGVKCSAEEAWAEVLDKVRSIGTLRLPGKDTDHGPAIEFDDPVTGAFMDATTWRALGQSTNDQLPSERRVFIERYRAHSARLRDEVQTGRALLPGREHAALKAAEGEP